MNLTSNRTIQENRYAGSVSWGHQYMRLQKGWCITTYNQIPTLLKRYLLQESKWN